MNLQQGSTAAAGPACTGLSDLAQVASDLLDPAPRLLDVVLVGAGLFKGCTGVVRDVEPGPTGLVTASVYVREQDRWTDQPYADSDLTVTARFIDDAYYDMPQQPAARHS
ncbi:hypothetical protein [Paraburkholderia youngii]|uniref:hypothetical protein n=1 Tax=Paraburkholderia youngii TaxID=2782701 RepID=UPI003D1A34D8